MVGAALIALLMAGWIFGVTSWLILAFLVAYLARHLIQIGRMLNWLREGGSSEPPNSMGIWEEIYYQAHQIKRKDKSRKKRFAKILNRFRKATSALPDATVILGPDDDIDWFNKAAIRMLNLKKGDQGQHIVNLVRHPDFVAYLRSKEYEGSVRIASPHDPAVALEVRIVPYGGGLRLLLAQDVSRLERVEQMRRDFVANVSHELRTPLTVLKGDLETLTNAKPEIPDRYIGCLQRIDKQSTRMQHLVDDLLLLTRLEYGFTKVKHTRISIAEMLRSICQEADALRSDRSPTEIDIESRADILGNEEELRSAFSNLIVNAIRHTPADASVKVHWRDDGQGVRLDVEDTGDGIAPQHLSRLTERFYRIDDIDSGDKGGTGLGLAIVKHVLTRHGAELEICSQLGKGSLFSCYFPTTRAVRVDEKFGT